MATYSIKFNNGQVEMTDGTSIKNIPLGDLLMNNGKPPTNDANFTIDQSITNYFDSIKDGTNSDTLQQLNIYPLAANRQGFYPPYTGLHELEYNILAARKYYLQRTAWLKLKKGHELDPPKQYNEIMWESGLGHEVFIESPVEVRKTFGSFIDPLSKTAGNVWPPPNNKLIIEPSFMEFMGFGNSSIEATALDEDEHYAYTMTIGCGSVCHNSNPRCILDNVGNPVDGYTLGNAHKYNLTRAVTTSGNAPEKVKYIVIKEWGDKLQVIIYIMYYYLYARDLYRVAMLTCDMVVFITSLIFKSLCIYTGALSGNRLDLLTQDLSAEQKEALQLQIGKRHYSIVEYIHQNEFEEAITKIRMKIEGILKENKFFIDSIQELVRNAETPIYIGSQQYVLTEEFYENCLIDIKAINRNARETTLLTDWTGMFLLEQERTPVNLELLYKQLKEFESKHLLVPFIKIKKGTKDKLTLLSIKSYTAQLPCDNVKPSFRDSTESFQILAIRNYRSPTRGGGALSRKDIHYTTFVEDDDGRYPYTFDLSDEPENRGYTEVSGDYYNFDLLKQLQYTFNKTLSEKYNTNSIYFDDGIYTLFVYNSYLTGAGIVDFDESTLENLIHFYDLDDDVKNILRLLESTARGSKLEGSTSPSGVGDYYVIGSGGKRKKSRKNNKRKKKNTKNNKKTNKKKNKTIKKQKKYHKYSIKK